MAARRLLDDVEVFSRLALGRPLRGYQLEAARAVVASVRGGAGLTFTVMFPRQAGKNELSAQLETFLLHRYQRAGGTLVKSRRPSDRRSPTRYCGSSGCCKAR